METLTNSMLCTLIHLTKNQLESKRQEISNLSQYTTKVIRESYNAEVEELMAIKDILDSVLKLHDDKSRSTKK
ncbi:hypothetical protein [uncultured Endozoicomonas sp.]|uniref:hypothetical protein n=1 Tax=uncultured Endozoicomonas sp. TaxID=432652 RepID=UPI002616EDF9|nr:hypothetical protein [uncultured Endozoicomonas sp.]